MDIFPQEPVKMGPDFAEYCEKNRDKIVQAIEKATDKIK